MQQQQQDGCTHQQEAEAGRQYCFSSDSFVSGPLPDGAAYSWERSSPLSYSFLEMLSETHPRPHFLSGSWGIPIDNQDELWQVTELSVRITGNSLQCFHLLQKQLHFLDITRVSGSQEATILSEIHLKYSKWDINTILLCVTLEWVSSGLPG